MKKHNEGHSAVCVCRSSIKAITARHGRINVQTFSTVFTEVFTISNLVSHWLAHCSRQIQLSKVLLPYLFSTRPLKRSMAWTMDTKRITIKQIILHSILKSWAADNMPSSENLKTGCWCHQRNGNYVNSFVLNLSSIRISEISPWQIAQDYQSLPFS